MAESPDTKTGRDFSPRTARELSSARLAAVQAIYQMDMTGSIADTVVTEFLCHRGGAELDEGEQSGTVDKALFAELVRGVAAHREELNSVIASLLVEDWPLDRLAKVMAAILSVGAFELMHRLAVPARVVINEYVDVAHAFFEAKEAGMVNGVLDRLARVLREAEMGPGDRTTEGSGGKRKKGIKSAG